LQEAVKKLPPEQKANLIKLTKHRLHSWRDKLFVNKNSTITHQDDKLVLKISDEFSTSAHKQTKEALQLLWKSIDTNLKSIPWLDHSIEFEI
jgi:hypothetical protein